MAGFLHEPFFQSVFLICCVEQAGGGPAASCPLGGGASVCRAERSTDEGSSTDELTLLPVHTSYQSTPATSPLQLPVHTSYQSTPATSPLQLPVHSSYQSTPATSPLQLPVHTSYQSTPATSPHQLPVHTSYQSTPATSPHQLPVHTSYQSTPATSPLQLPVHSSYQSTPATNSQTDEILPVTSVLCDFECPVSAPCPVLLSQEKGGGGKPEPGCLLLHPSISPPITMAEERLKAIDKDLEF
ncbi:hypothetical protein JOQ06_028872, partial [Pogonophryne albipinna]